MVDISNKITIHFSEEDVVGIVKEYVVKQGHSNIKNVNLKIDKKKWTEGYGMMERDYEKLVFNGIDVEIGD